MFGIPYRKLFCVWNVIFFESKKIFSTPFQEKGKFEDSLFDLESENIERNSNSESVIKMD